VRLRRAKRVSDVDGSCRLLIVPLFRGSSRFESLIISHHSRFTIKRILMIMMKQVRPAVRVCAYDYLTEAFMIA